MRHTILLRTAGIVAAAALAASTDIAPRAVAQGDTNTLVPPAAYQDLKWRSVGATRRCGLCR
jgi:hypothetical protein